MIDVRRAGYSGLIGPHSLDEVTDRTDEAVSGEIFEFCFDDCNIIFGPLFLGWYSRRRCAAYCLILSQPRNAGEASSRDGELVGHTWGCGDCHFGGSGTELERV